MLRLLGFLLLVVGAATLFEWALQTGFRRVKTSDFGIMNLVANGKADADIVVSGSSRALTHYDSAAIGAITGLKTLNIGLNGTQTDVQAAYLRVYLRNNRKPALVIHNLDPYAFQISHEIYDVVKFMPYLNQPELYSVVKRVYPSAWKWRLIPLYGFFVEDLRYTWLLGVRGLLGMHPAEDRILGFQGRQTVWTGDFDKFRESVKGGVTLGIVDQGVRDLADIAKACQEHAVPLLLVYSPEYHEMQALERDRREVFAHFHKIAAERSATVWDYSDSPLCRDQSLFYNSQHLNATGARAFSEDLAHRLVRLPILAGKVRDGRTPP
ncbi:hypothetical protein [Horticoccus sp. 23ND18S-11]